MALIKCTECGNMVSDKADKCPNCGCPVLDILNETIRRMSEEPAPDPDPKDNIQQIACPYCGHTEFDIIKEGFNAKNAAVGYVLAGNFGALLGAAGCNNIKRICKFCGTEF